MKRGISSLVSYSSSEEEADEEKFQAKVVKKRKLPTLSASIALPAPVDDPSLHQGRIRTTPHIEGQFAAHVYVSVPLKKTSPLHTLIKNVVIDTKEMVPTLQEFTTSNPECRELHVSLSRPIYLRAHQREEVKRTVRDIANNHAPFEISFASFSELINDEKTRSFLTLEVGAGHHELKNISTDLSPILNTFRQKGYYDNPRFHASIGWALLDQPSSSPTVSETHSPSTSSLNEYPTIPRFPDTLIPTLVGRYHGILSSQKVSVFPVARISVKIGKDVSSWNLVGT
ncbi:hypothetical protein FA15DRAFT_599415 [Coprinopsis marcescibilis]|uniref:U6 snRNA phosphodiesterase n=1 Tax=Coprinopsis marcescibilis TaxID=230819 RepID=A0A5C3KK38_COPMA|nr:hypothetical protein FA15DRAFT_599415 [Coprinopsis marcescibilis]